jgi:peptide/nickel transport system permease protein
MAAKVGSANAATAAVEASPGRQALRRLLRNHIAMVGLAIVLVVTAMALFAPWLTPHDPTNIDLRNRLQAPSTTHWLGTDENGRDILARLMYGARISLLVGLGTVALRALIGITVGLAAGYYGGRVDALLMRITDVFIAFPSLLLALAIIAIWGTGLEKVVLALSIAGWPQFARLVRGEVLSLKERAFVEAGRALGMRSLRLVVRHVLPNALPIIIVYASLNISAPIIAEAALSFLGLGIQSPDISWGTMLSSAQRFMRTAWWLATMPGRAITLTVIGFNLFGDGLRDAWDPKLRR